VVEDSPPGLQAWDSSVEAADGFFFFLLGLFLWYLIIIIHWSWGDSVTSRFLGSSLYSCEASYNLHPYTLQRAIFPVAFSR